ncbi:hypothetical protein Bbelb_377600 [Branchiostoma belcheri]|nr:hypothetical protein Bbelb_377600 [Branchiostoma belcheri]
MITREETYRGTMSGGRRRSRTGDTYGAMNMRESQTDWTHIADKAATTPNPLYGSRSDKQADGRDEADKTKCCKIRKKLWITIGIAFEIGVAIVVILAYCAVGVKFSAGVYYLLVSTRTLDVLRESAGRCAGLPSGECGTSSGRVRYVLRESAVRPAGECGTFCGSQTFCSSLLEQRKLEVNDLRPACKQDWTGSGCNIKGAGGFC